jgi:hypothetical protein
MPWKIHLHLARDKYFGIETQLPTRTYQRECIVCLVCLVSALTEGACLRGFMMFTQNSGKYVLGCSRHRRSCLLAQCPHRPVTKIKNTINNDNPPRRYASVRAIARVASRWHVVVAFSAWFSFWNYNWELRCTLNCQERLIQELTTTRALSIPLTATHRDRKSHGAYKISPSSTTTNN